MPPAHRAARALAALLALASAAVIIIALSGPAPRSGPNGARSEPPAERDRASRDGPPPPGSAPGVAGPPGNEAPGGAREPRDGRAGNGSAPPDGGAAGSALVTGVERAAPGPSARAAGGVLDGGRPPAGPGARDAARPPLAGRILDAAGGGPVDGVRVTLVPFRAGDVPEGELHGTAGAPPRGWVTPSLDADGGFPVPLPDPRDPRLHLAVSVQGPGWWPVGAVLRRRGTGRLWHEVLVPDEAPGEVELHTASTGDDGPRQRLEIRLRPAATAAVHLRGVPSEGVLVRVHPPVARASTREAPRVEVARGGRLVVPGEAFVLAAGPRGRLHLPRREGSWELALIAPPARILEHTPRGSVVRSRGRVRVVLPPASSRPVERREDIALAVDAVDAPLGRARLVDRDRRPLADAEVEVDLEGQPPVRVRTDDEGRFAVGVARRFEHAPPLGADHPRRGTLRIASPTHGRRTADVVLPREPEEVVLDAGPVPRLRLRLREAPEGDVPVRPEALETDLDLLPLRVDEDGSVLLRGGLDRDRSSFRLACRGYRPKTVSLPAELQRDGVLDLGDVRLDPGRSRTIRLVAPHPGALAGARLALRPFTGGLGGGVWPVDPDGRVVAGGLEPGRWDLLVEGPRIPPFQAVVVLHEAEFERPLEVEVDRTAAEAVRLTGRVAGIPAGEAAAAEVIERWWLAGREEVWVPPAYPLAPDGTFASRRHVAGAVEVEVQVIAAAGRGVRAHAVRRPRSRDIAFGDLRLERLARAEVEFRAEGAGVVLPPSRVALRGPEGAEEAARLRLDLHRLVLDGLRRGPWVLEWTGPGGTEEELPFEITGAAGGRARLTAERGAWPVETVVVRAVDSDGRPVPGLRAVAADAPASEPAGAPGVLAPPGAGGEPGVAFAPVRLETGAAFRLVADGFLDARVRTRPGEPVPAEIVMYRSAAFTARVLDRGGRPVNGTLEVSWSPLEPAPVVHGDDRTFDVRNGDLLARGLPPVRGLVRVRRPGADVAATREVLLAEGGEPADLGTLRLEERRSLAGEVLLPEGGPAPGAEVLLVPRERAHRYPLVEPPRFADVRWRTRADARGRFRLDGLPMELDRDLVLAARRPGTTNAVEDPLDLEAREHILRLGRETLLRIDVGYRRGVELPGRRFALEFLAPEAEGSRTIELGEIPPGLFGLHRFAGVRPGRYRVTWGLREPYTPFPGIRENAVLPPGGDARLALRVDGKTLSGTALLNGRRLDRGWVLLSYDPGELGGTRVGRVEDGRFTVVDPPRTFRAWAAVIPETSPQPLQDPARGTALPVELRGYHLAARQGRLRIDYEAQDVVVRFSPRFLERHPDAFIRHPSWEWDGSRFRSTLRDERIDAPVVRFPLFPTGTHRFVIRSRHDTLIHGRTIHVADDEVVIDVR